MFHYLTMKKYLVHSKELDGMRGCASLSVLVLHLFNTVPSTNMSHGWRIAEQLTGIGSLGVDVFFVLSGFLITSLLLADRGKPAYFRNFYWKRVLRIQPLYMLHLIAAWFLLPSSHGYVLLALLFIANFASAFNVSEVGPAWTLSIEEQFYLIWPHLVRRVSLRAMYYISLCMILFSAGLRSVMILFAGHAALRSSWYRLDGLAMGGLLACQWMGEGEGETAIIRSFLRSFHSVPLLVVAIAYGISFLCGWATSLGLVILPVNYVVYRSIRYIMHHPGSKWFGWLGSTPLVFVGAISYSLYMCHTIFIYLYDARIAPPTLDLDTFLVRALAVSTVTLITCIVVRYAVELPAQRLRRYVLSPPRFHAPGSE
jgi:peptidoglycan/LPS O-acetylase OafA/YrhL